MTNTQVIARLNKLSELIVKYKHLWNNEESRIWSWIKEYDGLKNQHPSAWTEYCTANGLDTSGEGRDCLA